MTLAYELDLQSPASYGHDLLTRKSSMSAVPKMSGNKRTDGQTDGGDCITSLANAVGKNGKTTRFTRSL